MMEILPGSVVLSRAGRDKGRLMAVLRVEGEYAYLVDGALRTLEKPKKKKFKHLFLRKTKIEVLRESQNRGNVIFDAHIRRELAMIQEQGGVNACQKMM